MRRSAGAKRTRRSGGLRWGVGVGSEKVRRTKKPAACGGWLLLMTCRSTCRNVSHLCTSKTPHLSACVRACVHGARARNFGFGTAACISIGERVIFRCICPSRIREHSVALSHQRAPATARGHQEMDGQAAGQAPLRVDSTAAAFGGARRTRPPSRDAGRAHRGRATWALVPALRLAPCHWAVLSVCWVLGRSGGLSEIR